jgi:hypothetical protein
MKHAAIDRAPEPRNPSPGYRIPVDLPVGQPVRREDSLMNNKRIGSVALLLAVAVHVPGTAAEGVIPRTDIDASLDREVSAAIRLLSSPELGGRDASQPGGAVTTAYLASRLEAEGWLPAGDVSPDGTTSFFQAFRGVTAEMDLEASRLEASGAGERFAARGGGPGGFLALPDRAEPAVVEGGLVFAGFGIRAPEFQQDDYIGLDVRDRVVLVFSGEPGETDPNSRWNGVRSTRHAIVAAKARLARSLGARALLVVPNPAGRAHSAAEILGGRQSETARRWLGLAGAEAAMPVLYLDPEVATKLVAAPGWSPSYASSQIESGSAAGQVFVGRTVKISLGVRGRREIELRNVVARRGGGHGLDGEVVVLGAHWDHLGETNSTHFPGANDNASGVAGLLATARLLRAAVSCDGREIVIVFWAAEEHGRLGSTWFAAHPPVPRERVAAVVNVDMLGRNNLDKLEYANVLQIIYSAAVPALREAAVKANGAVGWDLRFYPALRFQPVSDHYSFFEAGFPVVYPFAGYISDYHQTGDTADKVSVARVVRAARFLAEFACGLGSLPGPIRLDPTIQAAPPPDPFERPEQ